MSGYVASARIVSAAPRLARGERLAVIADEASRAIASPVTDVETVSVDALRPGPIVERLLAARERWSQLTFFLFDSDSWRS